MAEQKEIVAEYFDSTAKTYQEKNYGKKNIFLNFFFNERLTEATLNLDFENKSILDIGCGTGSLYNYIFSKTKNFNYYGTDISEGMLCNSNIPPEKRFTGNSYEQNYNTDKFDFIYLLGVITYLSVDELDRILDFAAEKLANEGQLIVTFNNKPSQTFYAQRILSPVMKIFGSKDKVISQNMSIKFYRFKEFKKLLTDRSLQIVNQVPLNQTIYPLNNFAPRFFIRFSAFIKKNIRKKSSLRFLSSDVLLFIKKDRGNNSGSREDMGDL